MTRTRRCWLLGGHDHDSAARQARGEPRIRVGTHCTAGSKGGRRREKGGAPTLLMGTSRCATPGCARGSAAQRPAWRGNLTTAARGAQGPAAAVRHPSAHVPVGAPWPFTYPCEQPQPRQPSPSFLRSARRSHRDYSAAWPDTLGAQHQADYNLRHALGLCPGLRVAMRAILGLPVAAGSSCPLNYSSQYAGDAGPQSVGPTALPTSDLSYSPAPTPRKMASEAAGTR